MNELQRLDDAALQSHYAALKESYATFLAKGLKLDMSRGKPSPEQLDLSADLMNCLKETDYKASDGTDCRNYGGLDGIPEAKALFAEILEASPQEIIIGGNSSLTMMHDLVVRAMLHGLPSSQVPWKDLPTVKFLCPSPGYDRHFAICKYLNIEMMVVDYKADGPDMDEVERLVAADPAIKGMWCVPKYSNPTGLTYSDAVVERLAAMPTAAPDFMILWDNAYIIHHLGEEQDRLLHIRQACVKAGNPDRVFEFSSTSKVSFPGAGIAVLASSPNNLAWLKKHMAIQSIGPDKLNQLRHVRFFRNRAGVEQHMRRHGAILKPKFDLTLQQLELELGGTGLAHWSNPRGGYFISLNTLPGCAKKVVAKAAEAGVVLTTAGDTYPNGLDPEDKNIRLAPSFPTLPELEAAIKVVALCVRLVSAEQEIAKRGLTM